MLFNRLLLLLLVILELVSAGAFDFSVFMINLSREYFAFFPGYVYFTDSSQANKTVTEE